TGDRTVTTDGNVTQHQGLQRLVEHRRPPDDRWDETLVTRDGRVSGLGKRVTFFLSTLTDEKGATKQHSHLDSTPHTLPVRHRGGRISHFSSAGGRDRVSGRLCINPDALRAKRFAAKREKIQPAKKTAESEGRQALGTTRRTPPRSGEGEKDLLL